jgi:hypothetical protein
LATIFGRDLNVVAPQSSIPASTVFNRVHAALTSSSGKPDNLFLKPSTAVEQTVQDRQPMACVSSFDRLQFPIQQPATRVSAFQRLQAPVAPSSLAGPQHSRPTAVPQLEERIRQPAPPGHQHAQPISGPIFPRCLSFGHPRRNCWKKIKCHFCNKEGHVKVDCHFYPDSGLKTRWVRKEVPVNNFGQSELPSQEAPADRPICEPRASMADPLLDLSLGLAFFPNKDNTNLAASAFPSSSKPNQAVASSPPSKSPPPNPDRHFSTSPVPPPSAADRDAPMANFAVDPASFIPGDYQVLHVDGRPQQCRSHIAGVIRPRHEDLAIASIQPDFPGDHPFATTRHFLRQFMEEETHCTLQIAQRCPLGSAYVRVSSVADRDWLVERSPHLFQGRQISFVEHNKGINHRAFSYNRECWLMLLAYPADLWSDEHIRGAVRDFGVLVDWDKELSSYAALIVKVRVGELHHIPHSCVISHGTGMFAESWAVPVFILSQKLLGAAPADEDMPPADGSTPHPLPIVPPPQPPQQQHHQGNAWGQWQPAPQHQQQQQQFQQQQQHGFHDQHNHIGQPLDVIFGNNGHVVDLNQPPLHPMPDLNVLPNQLNEEEFLELNDLLNPV